MQCSQKVSRTLKKFTSVLGEMSSGHRDLCSELTQVGNSKSFALQFDLVMMMWVVNLNKWEAIRQSILVGATSVCHRQLAKIVKHKPPHCKEVRSTQYVNI